VSYEITLDIADICVALRTADVDVADRLRDDYGPFVVSAGEPRARVQVHVDEGGDFIRRTPEMLEHVVDVTYSEGELGFKSFGVAASVDMDSGRGQLVMAPDRFGDVENFLRMLYAWLCLENRALLLHAATVVRAGKAYGFFGNSGSGKTTVANLSSGHLVLSDDLTIIKETAHTYWVHGSPFRGASFEGPMRRTRFPLAGLFSLRKDVDHSVRHMDRSHGVARLASCLPFIIGHRSTYERAMAICAALVEAVPVQTLHFCLNPGFWKVILNGEN
jgi:hypothetical protein